MTTTSAIDVQSSGAAPRRQGRDSLTPDECVSAVRHACAALLEAERQAEAVYDATVTPVRGPGVYGGPEWSRVTAAANDARVEALRRPRERFAETVHTLAEVGGRGDLVAFYGPTKLDADPVYVRRWRNDAWETVDVGRFENDAELLAWIGCAR